MTRTAKGKKARYVGLEEKDLSLAMDRLTVAILKHHGVSIPHFVAEVNYHRFHHNIHEFAARACHSSTVRREAILRSLPPSIVPISITVGVRARGLVRVRKLQLDRWKVLGQSSAAQTCLMITNYFLPETMRESLIGHPLNSVIESPYVDDRPIKRATSYTLEGHKGTAFMVDTDYVDCTAEGLVYRPQDECTPHKGPFADKHGIEWPDLQTLLATSPPKDCRTIARTSITLSLHDIAVYGGQTSTVLSIKPESNQSKNPQVYLPGCFFDFIFKGWIIPCDRLEPGELVTTVSLAKILNIE